MKQFNVQVKFDNGLQIMWTSVMANDLGAAYNLAYAQYGKANVMYVTEA